MHRADNSEGLDWQFPAGTVKPSEVPAARAAIEVLEETRVQCHVLRDLGHRIHPKTRVRIHYFACKYISGDAYNVDTEENSAAEWVAIPEAKGRLGVDLYPGALAYLDSV